MMPEIERNKKKATISVVLDGRYKDDELIHNLEEMLASELLILDWEIDIQKD